ncbi:MAG TPA: outer membrane lipoprotein-sorting protein [Steroidobacteraceae bacterium]|nr:outer membrane lipoprotein-sorting protein [Steroidobacteraceae bacterium]
MRHLTTSLLALALLTATTAGAAEPATPDSLLKQMKAWLEPAKPSVRHLTMTVRSSATDSVEWKAGQARGTVDGGNAVLTVLLSPADVRGTALLIKEEQGKPNSEWLYVPYLRRVRQILPVNEFESFLNTEFSDSDMGFVNLHNRKVTRLSDGTVNGKDAYQLQEVPDDQRTFKRIVTWTAKDTNQPLKREYYDVANRLWKVETFEDVAEIHGAPTAQRVRMDDVQTRYSSEYRITDIDYSAQIPKELFDWQHLPESADQTVWK